MKQYKKEFINSLLENKALQFGEFELNSRRKTPYFIDIGKFCNGDAIYRLGYFYAAKINDRFDQEEYDLIFGPAYKGIPLSVATAIVLNRDFNIKKRFAFNRKEPKKYGEKSSIVGKICDGDKIILVDDVITTGKTKYDIINLLNSVANNLEYVGLIVSVDRQEIGEIGENGTTAIEKFKKDAGIFVEYIVNISEIINYLWDTKKISKDEKEKIEIYLKKFGTGKVIEKYE